MRYVALCACAFGLIACSSSNTGQVSSEIGRSEEPPATGADDAPATGADDASATAGCTYTQGYWKNHPSAWPVTSLTIGGVAYSEQQLLDLFGTAPGGDASLILGHQLIAALLNTASGAAPSAGVAQAIDAAQAWMAANRGSSAALPYGVPAGLTAGQQATALTQTLDDFNSGLAGTAHCGSGGGGSSSGGTGSSGGGSDADSGPVCVPLHEACTNGSECCSASCVEGTCT